MSECIAAYAACICLLKYAAGLMRSPHFAADANIKADSPLALPALTARRRLSLQGICFKAYECLIF